MLTESVTEHIELMESTQADIRDYLAEMEAWHSNTGVVYYVEEVARHLALLETEQEQIGLGEIKPTTRQYGRVLFLAKKARTLYEMGLAIYHTTLSVSESALKQEHLREMRQSVQMVCVALNQNYWMVSEVWGLKCFAENFLNIESYRLERLIEDNPLALDHRIALSVVARIAKESYQQGVEYIQQIQALQQRVTDMSADVVTYGAGELLQKIEDSIQNGCTILELEDGIVTLEVAIQRKARE